MATTHTSLRIEDEIMVAIDKSRGARAGQVSRNSWILEAIAERLKRESHRGQEPGA